MLEQFAHFIQQSFVFSGLPPTIVNGKEKEVTPQSQREEFAKQLARQINKTELNKDDWSDLFWCLAQHTQQGRCLIVLDEISWMGSTDPNFLGKLKNAWDLYFKKNDQLILAICGSASAWIDKNILSSTGFLGRESLNLTLEELFLPDCAKFWNTENDRLNIHEKLKILSVQRGGDISEYLDDLIKSGFISRDFTWNIKDMMPSKLSHYRLKDNYSRFYLKYIFPNRYKIEQGNMKSTPFSALKNWNTILSLQVENLILSNRALVIKALQINPNDVVCDNPFFQRKTTKQAGCQIDYLLQTKYNTLYICEIKYSKNEVGTQIIQEMNEKIKRLNIPKNFSYRRVLIHVNGVNEALEDSQFFSNIIDIGSFFKET